MHLDRESFQKNRNHKLGGIKLNFRNYSKFLLIMVLAIVLVACSSDSDSDGDADAADSGNGEATEGGEIRVAYSAQPPVLDPQVGTAIITAEIMGHVFEPLLTTDSEYNIEPSLAESWEQSDDGLKTTFKLREGVMFHNGEEMLAEDVVASMNRWKDGPGGRGQFEDGVFEEVDDYTVELNLEEPVSTALVGIAQGTSSFSAIMPKEEIEKADSTSAEEFIGTGPFEFVEWKQDQNIHLKKFDDYVGLDEEADGLSGKKEALVDDIYFEFVLDSSTRVAGIQSGEYDIAHEVPYDSVDQLDADENIENQILPGAGTLIMFTNKLEGRLFNDVKAREALGTVMDAEEMMTAAFTDDRFYTLNHNLMMPHQEEQWYSDVGKDKYNVNDPEKAKKLFEEAGYDGETIKIMTSRDYEFMYNASVVLQQELEAIGMDVELDVYDWPTLLNNMVDEEKFDYDINMVWLGYKPEPTAHHFLSTGISGWTDSPKLTELTEKFRSQPTLEEALPVYDELQEWFYEYIPASKVGDYNRIDSTRNTIDNYQFSDRMILWNVTNDK